MWTRQLGNGQIWRVCKSRPALLVIVLLLGAGVAAAQAPPELTQPVNDFAGVIDPANEQALDSLVRSLERASGDVVVIAIAGIGELRNPVA